MLKHLAYASVTMNGVVTGTPATLNPAIQPSCDTSTVPGARSVRPRPIRPSISESAFRSER